MKPATWATRKINHLIVLFSIFIIFIAGIVIGEDIPIPTNSIKLEGKLKTVIVDNYYPYTFVNKSGFPDGFTVDLIKAVITIMGMDLEIKVDTWEHAIQKLEKGEIDLLPMMAYSEERDKAFDFSAPHTIAFDAFFTREDSKKITTIDDLNGKTVVVMKGDQAHNFLISSGIVDAAHLIIVNSLPEALRLLSSGKGDAALMPKLVGLLLINDLNLTNLIRSPAIVESYNRPFSFAVKDDNLLLLERLSQGLNIVEKTGQYRAIYNKWFGAIEPKELSLKSALKYIVGSFLVLLLIGSTFALWSFSLRKQVASRTKSLADEIYERKLVEEELRFQYEIMINISEAVYLIRMEDGLIVYTNPIFEKMFGYEQNEMIGKHVSIVNAPTENNPKETAREIMDILNEKGIWQGEVHNIKKDGTLFWCFANVSVFNHTKFGKVLISIHTDISERKQMEAALKLTERTQSELLDKLNEAQQIAMIGSWDWDLQTDNLWWSDETYRFFSVTPQNFVPSFKANEKFIHPDDLERYAKSFEESFQTGKPLNLELKVITNDRQLKHCNAKGKIVYDDLGKQIRFIGTVMDISEQKRAENERNNLQAQLIQAQKMESIGRLAGGVAHDFNNMLSIILGHTEMALEGVTTNNPIREDLNEIQQAAQRSADLTKQLLTFARKQIISPKVIDLNKTVQSMLNMMRRLIGENIDLIWKPAESLWTVKMDSSQIDQILANLCINARDAITGIGNLTIETGMKTFDQNYCAEHAEFVPGDFVYLEVSDDGCGMDKKTLDNLFEPFFTTKEMGKGTGLGLATVYGIIKQNKGFINVYSEPNKGTTFKIYLPRYMSASETPEIVPSEKIAPRGSETILLLEDEVAILDMTRKMLEHKGYKVLSAKTPSMAIAQAKEHKGEIHLLLTDVVMPEMNGRDIAAQLITLYPNLKLLFMSGYTANIIAHQGLLDDGVSFIQKPFSVADLAFKLREVLEKSNSANQG